MRTDEEFIKELRQEIATSQERRNSFTNHKLSFIIGLFGVGSIFLPTINTTAILYILPLIAFVFDLYILGENYGIRRAGTFIKKSPYASSDEILWEKTVFKHRDKFVYYAGQLSSLTILFASAVVLYEKENHLFLYWGWIVIIVLSIITIWLIDKTRNNKLKDVEEYIENERNKIQNTNVEKKNS